MRSMTPATTYTAVDVVIFSLKNDLEVLFHKRKEEPYNQMWALPGSFVRKGETLDTAAWRTVKGKVGLTPPYLEQLYTFGDPERDPRQRVVSVAYYALLRDSVPVEGEWVSVSDMTRLDLPLAFDHRKIIDTAWQRIRGKIEYVPAVAASLVPEEFTASELQQAYESVLGVKFDPGTFRARLRKFVDDGLVERLERTKKTVGAPAALHRFF